MSNFFDYLIIFAPIIGYIPQIIKIIKNKSDEGFNTTRLSFLFNSTILEFYLNFAYNIKNNYTSFHHYARNISLLVAFFGIILKIIVKTNYANEPENVRKHNIINFSLLILYSCIFIPIILLTNSDIIVILSILSTILNFLNYTPQIINTYMIKKSGALSYLAVIFDYIGNVGIFIYVMTSQNINLWLLAPIIIVNITIIIQLAIMYYYDYYIKKNKKCDKYIELTQIKNNDINYKI